MDEEALVKLSKDMKVASTTMTRNEARYLLSQYLTMQNNRKAADQKAMKMEDRDKGEPHAVLNWISDNAFALERQILGALEAYAQSQPMGQWALAIDGVGPVVAAGLLAHIDIEKCPTVGHIWRLMGFDPTARWESTESCLKWVKEHGGASDELIHSAALEFGRNADTVRRYATTDMEGNPISLTNASLAKSLSRRPHNAALKQIGYYAGESFVKCSKSPYRKVYDERKAYEQRKNESGEYAKQCERVLASRPGHAQAKTYKAGKLPDGHIHSRCKRYAVKQFLSDWHAEAYRQHFGQEPPKPYPIAILGHAHERKLVTA